LLAGPLSADTVRVPAKKVPESQRGRKRDVTVPVVSRRVDVASLVSAAEIAERAGVASPAAVHNWVTRFDDFPKPVRRWGSVSVWVWSDVERWLRKTDRLPEP
jgi:predicted DNA-binding transcriptional regulator AlpA